MDFTIDVFCLAATAGERTGTTNAGAAIRFRTAFLAMATTYSNFGWAFKKSSTAGCANPPSVKPVAKLNFQRRGILTIHRFPHFRCRMPECCFV